MGFWGFGVLDALVTSKRRNKQKKIKAIQDPKIQNSNFLDVQLFQSDLIKNLFNFLIKFFKN
jgi:hypothetical protein